VHDVSAVEGAHVNRDLVLVLGFLVVVLLLCQFLGDYWIGFGISLMMAVALTQSWGILSSLSGYISLGHVAFYGLGAYIVAASWGVLNMWAALFFAGSSAALLAGIIGMPALRVRGPYFVILTLGISELLKYGVIALDASKGRAGRLILGAPDFTELFWMMFALAAIATILAWGVRAHRIASGLRAIREDEEAAETIGVPVARYKLTAFVLSAIVPGCVGGVMVLRSTYFDPSQAFDSMISFSMIAMAIIGGSDDLKGPAVGAVFLTILSEMLWSQAPQLYMIILGTLLCCFVLFIPEGLCGSLKYVSLCKPWRLKWLSRRGREIL
jgi:branched-chain amino acid transport system permease protein